MTEQPVGDGLEFIRLIYTPEEVLASRIVAAYDFLNMLEIRKPGYSIQPSVVKRWWPGVIPDGEETAGNVHDLRGSSV